MLFVHLSEQGENQQQLNQLMMRDPGIELETHCSEARALAIVPSLPPFLPAPPPPPPP